MINTKKEISLLFIFTFFVLGATFISIKSVNPPVFNDPSFLGKHDIVELYGCNKKILTDLSRLEKVLTKAAHVAGAQKIGHIACQTDDNINSCIIIVSESHLSVHAFPLLGYVAVDIFTCGECDNEKAIAYIEQELQSQSNHHKKIKRGMYKKKMASSQYALAKNDQKGEHLIVELSECEESIINDEKKIEDALKKAVQKAGGQVIDAVPYKFHPQGVSCIVLAKNGSQITIHTWPELSQNYCAIDILTCGNYKPDESFLFLKQALKAKSFQVIKIPRGFSPAGVVERIPSPKL